jgi:hypothetical protein
MIRILSRIFLATLLAAVIAAGGGACSNSGGDDEHFDTLIECWMSHMEEGFTAENALAHCHHDFADQWPADWTSEDECVNDPDHDGIDADAVMAFCTACFATPAADSSSGLNCPAGDQ